MHYTQDESYYLLDAKPGAVVYLGLKERVDREAMADELRAPKTAVTRFRRSVCQPWPCREA